MKQYTESEERLLRENYDSNPHEMAEVIDGVTPQNIRRKASAMGVTDTQNQWTESEEQYLKERYALTPNEVLASALDRSCQSVKGKAGEEGWTKDQNHVAKHKILTSERKSFDNTPKNHFLAGLAAGEGCFTKNTSKVQTQYFFQITMAERDTHILREFKDVLGVGSITHAERPNDQHSDTVRYDVTSAVDHFNSVIPFFNTFGRDGTYKQKQFEEWKRELCEDYLTVDGSGIVDNDE